MNRPIRAVVLLFCAAMIALAVIVDYHPVRIIGAVVIVLLLVSALQDDY